MFRKARKKEFVTTKYSVSNKDLGLEWLDVWFSKQAQEQGPRTAKPLSFWPSKWLSEKQAAKNMRVCLYPFKNSKIKWRRCNFVKTSHAPVCYGDEQFYNHCSDSDTQEYLTTLLLEVVKRFPPNTFATDTCARFQEQRGGSGLGKWRKGCSQPQHKGPWEQRPAGTSGRSQSVLALPQLT